MNLLNRRINRRKLLQSAGISALGLSLGLKTQVIAQDAAAPSEFPLAMSRFSIGDISATIVQESTFELPIDAFGGGAPEGAVAELLESRNLPTTGITTGAKPLILNLGDELAILDTGTGQNTVASLEGAGINPGDITRVILSHWHGDHVGGVSADGTLNFPNATHHFPQADWDFLQTADNENAQGSLASLQPAEDAGVLEFYSAGELLPGIEAISTPGHTPGHHSLLITSGDAALMFTGDAFNHHITTLTHPDWAFNFDGDPELAAQTRRELMERLADDGTHMFAYHFPFMGTGYVSRRDEAFEFTMG